MANRAVEIPDLNALRSEALDELSKRLLHGPRLARSGRPSDKSSMSVLDQRHQFVDAQIGMIGPHRRGKDKIVIPNRRCFRPVHWASVGVLGLDLELRVAAG